MPKQKLSEEEIQEELYQDTVRSIMRKQCFSFSIAQEVIFEILRKFDEEVIARELKAYIPQFSIDISFDAVLKLIDLRMCKKDERLDDKYLESEPVMPAAVAKDFFSANRLEINSEYSFSVPANK